MTPLLRQRSVTLPISAQDATVRVARGTLTTLTFDSALAAKSVQLAGRDTHFERVVAEERTLTLKPKVELKPGERLLLSVRFADGAAPQEATFELVAAGEEVDASVEVVRRARNVEALEAALAAANSRAANRAADRISGAYRELRRRAAAVHLLPLLKSEDENARSFAAAHALEFAPEHGREHASEHTRKWVDRGEASSWMRSRAGHSESDSSVRLVHP